MNSTDNTADRPPTLAATISALLKSMPAAGAPVADRVAWFENKADVLEVIAGHEHCDDPDTARQLAENARRMAQTIRNEEGTQR
jgi:hypothetical protein